MGSLGMNILPIFVWVATVVFTLITLLPFAVQTIQFHWGIRGVSAVLMIIGWFLVFTRFIH